MGKHEEGEFELVLGNRQLVSVFLIAVILFGVFFALGYVVARSSLGTVEASTVVMPAQSVQLEDLPPDLLRPVPNGSASTVSEVLKRRTSLTLNGSTLMIGGIGENRSVTLACNTLRMINGAKIITNGNNLVIVTLTAEFGDNAGIHSFTPQTTKAAKASAAGADGGNVRLNAIESFSGSVRIVLAGQEGGDGAGGAQGSQGLPGNRGADAVKGLFDCRSGGQDGSQGGQGGRGATGEIGGKGGDGGDLILEGAARSHKDAIIFTLRGGKGGHGGTGGLGGGGGPGGQGGSGDGPCGGGRAGVNGLTGPLGDHGADGADGRAGHRTPE